jgi:hypothetical protein
LLYNLPGGEAAGDWILLHVESNVEYKVEAKMEGKQMITMQEAASIHKHY